MEKWTDRARRNFRQYLSKREGRYYTLQEANEYRFMNPRDPMSSSKLFHKMSLQKAKRFKKKKFLKKKETKKAKKLGKKQKKLKKKLFEKKQKLEGKEKVSKKSGIKVKKRNLDIEEDPEDYDADLETQTNEPVTINYESTQYVEGEVNLTPEVKLRQKLLSDDFIKENYDTGKSYTDVDNREHFLKTPTKKVPVGPPKDETPLNENIRINDEGQEMEKPDDEDYLKELEDLNDPEDNTTPIQQSVRNPVTNLIEETKTEKIPLITSGNRGYGTSGPPPRFSKRIPTPKEVLETPPEHRYIHQDTPPNRINPDPNRDPVRNLDLGLNEEEAGGEVSSLITKGITTELTTDLAATTPLAPWLLGSIMVTMLGVSLYDLVTKGHDNPKPSPNPQPINPIREESFGVLTYSDPTASGLINSRYNSRIQDLEKQRKKEKKYLVNYDSPFGQIFTKDQKFKIPQWLPQVEESEIDIQQFDQTKTKKKFNDISDKQRMTTYTMRTHGYKFLGQPLSNFDENVILGTCIIFLFLFSFLIFYFLI